MKGKTLTEGQSAMKTLTKRRSLMNQWYGFILLLMIIPMLLYTASAVWRAVKRDQLPITSGSITIRQHTDSGVYKIKDKGNEVRNGNLFYSVQIGDYTLEVPSDVYNNSLEGKGEIATDIYSLKATSSERWMFDIFGNRSVTKFHLSALGQGEFTEQEIADFGSKAPAYLTAYKKNYLHHTQMPELPSDVSFTR